MAVIDTVRPHLNTTGSFGQFIARLSGAIATWNDSRKTRKALSSLSDRELEDIGLTRADIDTIGLHR